MDREKKVIGVCGTRIFNQIPMQFINVLRKIGLDCDYYTIAFSSYSYFDEDSDDSIGESQLFELARYINFSGLVILTETIKNPKLVQKIAEIGHSKNIPVFSVDGTAQGCYNLTLNYHNGFEQMVRHVIKDHGCTQINMLAGFKGNAFSEERVDIYKKVLQENNIPFEPERLEYGDFWERPTRKAMEKFLDRTKELPQAIICANDAMAITACSVLNERGFQVPEDIIVTGFDGTNDARYHFPCITTGEPDYENAASFIIKEIQRVEKTGVISPVDTAIKFTIRKDQSCGCRPKIFHNINTILSSLSKDVGDCAWHNISMNNMVTSVLDKKSIMDIAENIPEYVNLWSDCFRFACVKSSLMKSCDAKEDCTEMTTILRDCEGKFDKPGETFQITDFVPRINEIIKKGSNVDTLVVRLLNSGKNVYGYIVEGFQDLDDRRLQRCNEFAMFLTHSIDTVIHNYKMTELNESLSKAYEKISNLYILDSMTGIYNRRGFFQNLTTLVNETSNLGKYLYIFSIDMDGLKYINDTFGHNEGDFAIITLAKAITKVSGPDAICSRFGGDEFTCAILADSKELYQAELFSQKLKEAIEQTEGISEKPYEVTASVGITAQKIKEDLNIDTMLLAADRLMYHSKVARHKQRRR